MSEKTEAYTVVLEEFLGRSYNSAVCILYIGKYDLEKGREFPIIICGFDRRVKFGAWSFSSSMLHFFPDTHCFLSSYSVHLEKIGVSEKPM